MSLDARLEAPAHYITGRCMHYNKAQYWEGCCKMMEWYSDWLKSASHPKGPYAD
jgi:hypothetical protein